MVPHLTVPVVGFPFHSVIEAVNCTVRPIASVSGDGVTVTTYRPNVTVMDTSSVSGVRTAEIVWLLPGATSSVTDPACVSIPPASKARIVMVRWEPAGNVMAPAATPSVTGRLNTSGVGISGAATFTTTVATAVPETSALMTSVPSPLPGPTAV